MAKFQPVRRFAECLKLALKAGHHMNPAEPVTVDPAQLEKLRQNDEDAKRIIRSYQDFHKLELDQLALRIHGRAADADGDAGPATFRLFELPRCGVPDFGAEAGANWPADCRGHLRTGYDFRRLSGLDQATLKQAWLRALGNWNGALSDVQLLLVDNPAQPVVKHLELWAEGEALPGPTLAYSGLARNRCDVCLQERYDTTIQWWLEQFEATAAHELGHFLGLGHIPSRRRALMNSVIHQGSIDRRGFPYGADLEQAEQLGYLVADNPQFEPPEDPDRPAPEPPQQAELIGNLTVVLPNGERIEYFPKRKPRV